MNYQETFNQSNNNQEKIPQSQPSVFQYLTQEDFKKTEKLEENEKQYEERSLTNEQEINEEVEEIQEKEEEEEDRENGFRESQDEENYQERNEEDEQNEQEEYEEGGYSDRNEEEERYEAYEREKSETRDRRQEFSRKEQNFYFPENQKSYQKEDSRSFRGNEYERDHESFGESRRNQSQSEGYGEEDDRGQPIETSIDLTAYLMNNTNNKDSSLRQYSQVSSNQYQENEKYKQNYYLPQNPYEKQDNSKYESKGFQNSAPKASRNYNIQGPKINVHYEQAEEDEEGFDDQEFITNIRGKLRVLSDRMENSFSDITKDHSRGKEKKVFI